MAELQRMHTALSQLVDACPGHGTLDQCPILAALTDDAGMAYATRERKVQQMLANPWGKAIISLLSGVGP
jgi:hypothetical protein